MCNDTNFKRIFVQANNGNYCIPAPVAVNMNGEVKQVKAYGASMVPTATAAKAGRIMQQSEYAALTQRVASNSGNVLEANYQNSPGVNIATRLESVKGSGGNTYVYSISFTAASSGNNRIIIGDAAGTYAAIVAPGTTAVTVSGGTFGTNSLTQFNTRSGLMPFRVTKIQMVAGASTFFNQANLKWFTTNPTSSGYKVDNIDLTALLNANQFNPTIQEVDMAYIFSAATGLDLTIPASGTVTFNFTVQAQASASAMELLN